MKILDIPVAKRETLGSAESRRYCRAGKIPTNLYGAGQESVALVLEADDFEEVLKAHSAIVRLSLGGNEQTAIVREVTWDTFGEYIQHVDLMRVQLTDEIQIQVPMHFIGIPVGASHGGVLHIIHKEIPLFCRVDSIPGEIHYDASELDLDDRITIADLKFPEHVRPVMPEDELVAHIKEPRVAVIHADEDEAAEDETPEGEDGEAGEGDADKSE